MKSIGFPGFPACADNNLSKKGLKEDDAGVGAGFRQ
jgi:hypothetical protein